jgi:natural resistance-associated macrophage protein 2
MINVFDSNLCYIVAGDLQAGAYGGYGLIWSLFLATFCGLIIQILAARLAIVTNKDLATHCREQFSKPLTYTLWFMAEIAIIGSDIQVSNVLLISYRK